MRILDLKKYNIDNELIVSKKNAKIQTVPIWLEHTAHFIWKCIFCLYSVKQSEWNSSKTDLFHKPTTYEQYT